MINQHQKNPSHFRTWKAGKNWLYSASALAMMIGLSVITEPVVSKPSSSKVYAEVLTSTTSPSSDGDALFSSVMSKISKANHELSMAASAASSAGVVLNSEYSTVNLSVADGSSYANSVAHSIAADYSAQAASLASLAATQTAVAKP